MTRWILAAGLLSALVVALDMLGHSSNTGGRVAVGVLMGITGICLVVASSDSRRR